MKKRYHTLDGIRGLALINIIIYHAIWDLVHIFGFDWQWYRSHGAYIWQQVLCCTFILVSGFCRGLGKEWFKRGITVFLAGIVITLVTLIATPESRIIFGVLTLIGSCMLIQPLIEPLLKKCQPIIGFTISLFLFCLTRHIAQGAIGLGSLWHWKIPAGWYRNLLTAYFGFPSPDFFSSDYFPLFPWFFLFITGYFMYRIAEKYQLLYLLKPSILKPVEWLGRHSLVIYMLHQPVIYLLFTVLF